MVPLKALLGGLRALEIRFPFILKLSPFAIPSSPSHAKNPILDKISELTSIFVSVISKELLFAETLSIPSKRLI
ncbi:MAG TPA: hypothetical protein PLV43_03935 [Aequorivita sp.]|nr:hypothetical protein [Aequorivita sp.]